MRDDLVMMQCGHAANGWTRIDGLSVPCCIICDEIRVKMVPDLTGRMARCAYFKDCGNEQPSSMDLWFFEFLGPGGAEEKHCNICGYYAVAHELINPGTGRPRPERTAHDFVPRPPRDTDRYYCACRGTD